MGKIESPNYESSGFLKFCGNLQSQMKALIVFTPTYNRLHTLGRTYQSLCQQSCKDFEWLIIDDGSTDGTREWVESLGEKIVGSGSRYDWMGRRIDGEDENHFVIETNGLKVTYIKKPNGGLYTGYNVAYSEIETELCVCVDSDDYMPDDSVEKILTLWKAKGSDKYCGVIGLDFYADRQEPIGGYFPSDMTEAYRSDLFIKKIHCGDSKEVMRTELMKKVAPQVGFEGEKNFNPSYMLAQVWDKLPLLVINGNLCNVEYQIGADSMSQGIYRQYVNSPKSFAKHRIMQMGLTRYPYSLKFRSAAHYVSSCIISKDKNWFKNTPMKLTTILAAPMGIAIYLVIKYKTR